MALGVWLGVGTPKMAPSVCSPVGCCRYRTQARQVRDTEMASEWCAQDHSWQKVPGLRPGTRGLGGMNECAQEPGQEHCRHPSLSQGARGLGGMAECAGCFLNRLSSRIAMVLQGHCSRLLRAFIKTAAVLQARPSRCRGPSGSAQKGRSSRS